MAKYRVYIPVKTGMILEVEAETAEDAIEMIEPPEVCHLCAEFLAYDNDNMDWDNAEAKEITDGTGKSG